MTARVGGEGRPLRALALLGMGLLGYAIGRAPAVIERIGADAALIAERVTAPVASGERAHRPAIDGSPLAANAVGAGMADIPSKRALQPVIPATRASRLAHSVPPGSAPAAMAKPGPATNGVIPVVDKPPAMPTIAGASDAPPPGPGSAGFESATQAYADLAKGNRRTAAAGFEAALAAAPESFNAPAWRAESRRLRRRWSGQAWSLVRDGGGALVAASPVLGGGQSGANIGYNLDPLSRRPLALIARVAVPDTGGHARPIHVTQFALGIEWQPVRGVRLSAERLIAAGPGARNDFALRLGAGASGERHQLAWSGYGEAGVIGLTRGDAYVGGETKLGWRGPALGPLTWTAGGGVWGSAQWAGNWSTRLDAGPTFAVRLPLGRASLTAAADYRFRLAGNALPGSGPAVTLSTAF